MKDALTEIACSSSGGCGRRKRWWEGKRLIESIQPFPLCSAIVTYLELQIEDKQGERKKGAFDSLISDELEMFQSSSASVPESHHICLSHLMLAKLKQPRVGSWMEMRGLSIFEFYYSNCDKMCFASAVKLLNFFSFFFLFLMKHWTFGRMDFRLIVSCVLISTLSNSLDQHWKSFLFFFLSITFNCIWISIFDFAWVFLRAQEPLQMCYILAATFTAQLSHTIFNIYSAFQTQ